MKLGLFITLFASLASLFPSSAANYAHPDESKELFKVEKIPLQVHQIKEASHCLTVLALNTQGDSPAELRCAGQLLALALRLDYANQDARLTSQRLHDGKPLQKPNAQAILEAQAQLRILQTWLSLPASGENANTLANYLADATRLQRPETKENPDQADWAGLLPPLLSYTEEIEESSAEQPSITPVPTPEVKNPYQIAQLTLYIPVATERIQKEVKPTTDRRLTISQNSTRNVEYKIRPITINITPHNTPLTLKVEDLLETEEVSDKQKKLSDTITVLEQRLNKSSENGTAKISIKLPPEDQYSAENSATIAAAVQVMLKASLSDTELRDDTVLCAALHPSGHLTIPPHFWQNVQSLRKNKGSTGRLIVPKSAAKTLAQLLVFDDPEFFTRWEIYAITHIDEAHQMAAKNSATAMAQSEELFQAIKKRAKTGSVASLTVNKSFRNQLNSIIQLTPNHLSAKTLLLQGSGKRPMRLNRLGQANELQPILQHIQSQLNELNISYPNQLALQTLYEKSRKDLDTIEGVIDNRNDSSYQKALKIVTDIRTINTLIKRSSRSYSSAARSRTTALITTVKNDTDQLATEISFTIRNSSVGR